MSLDWCHSEIREIIKLEERCGSKFLGLYKTRGIYFTCPLCLYHGILDMEKHLADCEYNLQIWSQDEDNYYSIIKFDLRVNEMLISCYQDYKSSKTSIQGWSGLSSFRLPIIDIHENNILFNLKQENAIKHIKETLETLVMFS